MKFRKEHQRYLLIVIAIITTGYFLKPFFFNKKKKVIEGQAGATTYYRIAFNSTDLSKLLNTLSTPPTPTQEDLLKELILTQYDTVLTDATGIKYVKPDTKYDGLMMNLIPATLLMKDSLGLKVAACTGNKLDFFNKEAAAAASYTGPAGDATAAAAAYDYARLILSNTYKDEIAFKKEAAAAADTADATAAAAAYEYARLILSNTYKDDVNIKALIAAANFLTIMAQPTLADNDNIFVARNANLSAYRAATNASAKDTGANAGGAYSKITSSFAGAATLAATAAAYADTYAKGLSIKSYSDIENNANYKKVLAKYYPANINAAFITAAGLIYQSVYEKINKTGIMALIAAADFLTFIGQPDIKYNDPRIGTTSATVSAAASAAANYAPMAYSAAANTAGITRYISLFYDSWGYPTLDNDVPAGYAGTNAAKAAGYADAYAKGQSVDDNTVTSNANYRLIKEGAGGRQGSNMVSEYNLKAKFIQAAGLIYKSVYEKLRKI